MDAPSKDIHWVKKTKWLIQTLIVSVTLNIGFLITFGYFVWKDSTSITDFSDRQAAWGEGKDEFSLKNSDLLTFYSGLSYPELVTLLLNKQHVEEGYTKRDLALACLVAFHHFHLEKALGAPAQQKRMARVKTENGQKEIEIAIFPALAEFQYQAVVKFAKTEKWPLTSQGIFYEIQRTRIPRDPTLLEAFYLTPEFYSVLNLFSHSELRIDKQLLVEMVAEFDWSMLQSFFEQQKEAQDFSVSRRRFFLLDFLKKRSKIAAMLLIQTDREFAEKKLDDEDVMTLLDLTQEKSVEAEKFAKDLLISARSDMVWKKAAKKLYDFCGEPIQEPYDHRLALQKFIPEEALSKIETLPEKIVLAASPPAPIPAPEKTAKKTVKKKVHVIQQGDSLWKIAKKYKVSVEALMKINHLESEKLRVGKELEIPQ
ncbi:MAG: LysM peptidoglycan-binding domain-containing protein [Chlamydiae bacterium]|nr:LysM peptidoglycan-binding domain-containing protein [Chlamydiota bacterium]